MRISFRKRGAGVGRRMLTAAALALVATWGVFGFAASRALAGDRRTVCSDRVYVRNYPQGRAWAQLYRGQTFEVYEYRQSGWARGFAYGYINKGKSPYASPFDNVWIQVSAFCPR